MTYISNWIEVKRPDCETDTPEILSSRFSPPHENYGPYALRDWANRNNLSIDYVDNCWLRVELSDIQLRNFLSELYGPTHSYVCALIGQLRTESRYVVVAEEF